MAKYVHKSQGRLGPPRTAAFEEFRRTVEPTKELRPPAEGTTTEILKKRIDTTKVQNAWKK